MPRKKKDHSILMVADTASKTHDEVKAELHRHMHRAGLDGKRPTIETVFDSPHSDIRSFKIRHDE